ncbi:hypothetical protein GGI14_006013, partial [Coemansia sp. S680]
GDDDTSSVDVDNPDSPCEALPTVNPKLPETISEMPDASMLPSADAEEHKSPRVQHRNT